MDSRSFTTPNQISGCTHAPCRIHTDATFPVSKFKEEKPFAQSPPNHNCHDKPPSMEERQEAITRQSIQSSHSALPILPIPRAEEKM
jgi:hypothetical protein